ncbi:hypothetical protein RsS62_32400 [Rhizobium dioscoreae]|uniref:DUF2326 domain-containing protein n=1 Tax=Rhizobium dioscoreae TaxID=2653122 RepID=UPI001260FFFA|nr:DUF2326 domain-containing protein [Rhizobium dioscoreae]GES43988.1 hypothetical protein RsS62_32400 [Rhizobium dioscoreae]
MASQVDLFAPVMTLPKAPEGRGGPRLWVRRLAIFKNHQTIIRDVLLKPGLNIIWTPDMSSSGRRALAHGSGKSTFCRLLRACLGEPSYATDAQRLRLMTRLPDGLFAAEILIDGICWVAIRPLGLPGGEFVVQADTIEEAIARGRSDGDQGVIDPVIIGTFFPTLAGATPPEIGREQVWDVLRAWLTRDQECRLADILAWRSSQTQTRSRAQVLGETAKLTMVRLALRALDAEERAAAARERELLATVEDERRRHTYQQQRYTDGLKSVRLALGVSDEVGFENTIDQKGLISLAEAALAEAMRTAVPKPPDVGAIFARQQALNAEREMLTTKQQQLDNDARFKRGEAERYRSEANLGEIDITQGRIRVCPVCRVSIDEIKANGCGISLEPCDLAALKSAIADKQKKAAEVDAEAGGAEQESKLVGAQIQQLEAKRLALEAEVKTADDATRAAQAVTKEIQDRIYRARRTLEDARSLRESAKNEKPAPSGTTALDAVRAQLDAGRTRARVAIRTLEERYQGIMAAWLPEGITSTIRLDGHGLKVDAEFAGRGEVSTAALDSLKIVAFDLAALHMAIEEQADLPAFLIHDSPREADLDGQLYAGLFNLVQQWEEAGTPCFQYIVTTTTAPPAELQIEHFVRLEMSSTPAEMRLFKMDI